MRIDQLLQAIEIAKTGSLNKAAQNLFLSQPSLSLSVKRLEEELGIHIFARGFKGMSLTPEGQQLVSIAEPICNQLSMVPALFARRSQPTGITFNVSNAYLKFVINVYAELVNTFAKEGLQSLYLEANSGDVLEDVVTQRADIGVLYIVEETKSFMLKLFEYREVTYHRLLGDGYWIILGPGNPLYHEDRTSVTLEDIAPYPLVVYEEKHRATQMEISKSELFAHKTVICVNNRASMTELISTTDAINIGAKSQMPYKYTSFYPHLKTLELLGVPNRQEVGWICRNQYSPNEAGRFFLTRLIEITTGIKPTSLVFDREP